MRTIAQKSYADAVLTYARSYAESYASYARHLMRHKTLHKIKSKEKSYAVLCASLVLQAKVLCASYTFFLSFVFVLCSI